MDIFEILIAVIAAFGLLQFFLIPEVGRKWGVNPSPHKIRWLSLLACLKILRTLCQIAILTYGPFCLFLWVYPWFAEHVKHISIQDLQDVIRSVEKTQLRLKVDLSKFLDSFYAGIAFVGLIYLAYRRQKQSLIDEFQAVVSREFTALKEKYERGDWEALEPTDEMKELVEKFVITETALEKLEKKRNNKERAKQQQDLRDNLSILKERLIHLDLIRRMNLVWEPGQFPGTGKAWWWPPINVLFSKGMADDVGALGKWASRLATACLLVSLIGASQGVVLAALSDHIDQLTQIEVKLTARQAQESLKFAAEQIPEETQAPAQRKPHEMSQPTDDQQSDLAYLAQQFNQTFVRGIVREAMSRAPAEANQAAEVSRKKLRKAAVAGQILTEAVNGAPPGATIAEASSPSEQQFWQPIAANSKPSAPQVVMEVRAAELAKEDLKTSPSAWNRIAAAVAEHRASYKVPASTLDYVGALGGALIDFTFDVGETSAAKLAAIAGVPEATAADAIKLAKDVVSDEAKDAIKAGFDLQFRGFLTDIVGGRTVEEALVRAERASGRYASLAQEQALARVGDEIIKAIKNAEIYVEKYPPSLLADSGIHDQAMAKKVEDLLKSSPERLGAYRDGLEFMVGYENYFPGQFDSDTRTSRDKLLVALADKDVPPGYGSPDGGLGGGGGGGGGGGWGGGGGHTSKASPAKPGDNFLRSRNYSRLRGFSRVGGVLIGLPPAQGKGDSLDFRDIQWRETSPNLLELTLSRADGTLIRLGPYRKRLIHQALAYAADARALTVTMVTAQPLLELKILVHPALIDTPLGCRAIELDRFVDRFTGSADWRRDSEQKIQAQADLYSFAWQEKFKKGVLELAKFKKDLDAEEIARLRAAMAEVDKPNLASAASALEHPDDFSTKEKSPLAATPSLYERELVEEIQNCARTANKSATDTIVRLSEFQNCLDPMDLSGKISTPPRFVIWSGVREQEYALDKELSFASLKSKTSPWPFDFILQVAFDQEIEGQETQWDFQDLRKAIRKAIVDNIAMHADAKSIYSDMAEFALLQRLFRAIFNENLGSAFPMEKLVDLVRATATPPAEIFHTPRWNPRPGLLETRQAMVFAGLAEELARNPEIDEKDQTWSRPLVDKMRSCVDLITQTQHPESIGDDVWKSRCGLSDVLAPAKARCGAESASMAALGGLCPGLLKIGKLADEVAGLRQLRAVLEIDKEAMAPRRSSLSAAVPQCPEI